MLLNPYELEVTREGNAPINAVRRFVEPFVSEHMEGFGKALEGRVAKDPIKRAKAHEYMRIALATAHQSKTVANWMENRANPLASFEATTGQSTLNAQVTSFVTQMIHMSLDVYPRLIARRLVSVQPFTQPSGYVFFLKRVAKEDGPGGVDRDLNVKSTFDRNFSLRTTEGSQVAAVGVTLTKELVEVQWHALMRQHSHEVDTAMRTQYGLDIGMLGDMAAADELAWEVDRQVVVALVDFAATNTRGIAFHDDTLGGTYSSLTPSEQNAADKQFLGAFLSGIELDMAQDIYSRPNWILCGLNVAKLMAKTPEFTAVDRKTQYFDQSITKGSLIRTGETDTGMAVWFDPQMSASEAVIGFVDNMNPFFAGYIFSPFGAASIITAAFMDPDVLMEKRSQAVAFAQKGVNAQQFRVIRLGTNS